MPPQEDAIPTRSTRRNPQRGATPGPGPTTVAGGMTTRGTTRKPAVKPKSTTPALPAKTSRSTPPSLKRTSSEALSSSDGDSDAEDDEQRMDVDRTGLDASSVQEGNGRKEKNPKRKRKRRKKVKVALTTPIGLPSESDTPMIKSKDKGKRKASVLSVPSPPCVSESTSYLTATSTSTLDSATQRPAGSSQTLRSSPSVAGPAAPTLPTESLLPAPAETSVKMEVELSGLLSQDDVSNQASILISPNKTNDKGKGKAKATSPLASIEARVGIPSTPLSLAAGTSTGPDVQMVQSDAATEALKAEIARLKQEVNEHKRLPTLTQHVTCLICLELLWRPFGVVPCGHVVCYGCLVRWFCAPPPGAHLVDGGHANPDPNPAAGVAGAANPNGVVNAAAAGDDNAEDRELQRMLDNHHAQRGMFRRRAKTCPVCRCVVRERPVEVWAMKAIVAVVGRAAGQDAPNGGNANVNQLDGGAAREQDPWRNIFGPVPLRQHGQERGPGFLENLWGRGRRVDEEDFFDDDGFEDDLTDEELEDLDEGAGDVDEDDVQDAIENALAWWEGQGQGPRPRNVVPIADRMRLARGAGAGWRARRRRGAGGVGAGAGPPPVVAPGQNDNGQFGWHDAEDGGIYRCWDCMHEIWDGLCAGCGRAYDVPDDHDHDLNLDLQHPVLDEDEADLDDEIRWLEEHQDDDGPEEDDDEDEDDDVGYGGGFGYAGGYRRRPHLFEEEDDEEAEPGEFDGWLEEDDAAQGGLHGGPNPYGEVHDDDDDDGDGLDYGGEWQGLRDGYAHENPHGRLRRLFDEDEDSDGADFIDDGPVVEELASDEEDIAVDAEDGNMNQRNIGRRIQLAALRRRGLVVSDDEEDSEGDDGEGGDIVEVVEDNHRVQNRRAAALPRRYVELSSDEDEGEAGVGGVVGRGHDRPVRNVGGNANRAPARQRGRVLVVSDSEEEPARALPRRRPIRRPYSEEDE